MPRRRRLTRSRGSGPMDRYITGRSAARTARRIRALRMAGYAGAARALVNPYVATAAAVAGAGYGIYRGVKYLRYRRKQRKVNRAKKFREGIRMLKEKAFYERSSTISGTALSHNTNANILTLNPSNFNQPGTATSLYNHLRLLVKQPAATDLQKIYLLNILQNLTEGASDDQRAKCAIDVKSLNFKITFINRAAANIRIRLLLVEKKGPVENISDPDSARPRSQFIPDLFQHPDDPCVLLDFDDSYWGNEDTGVHDRLYAKLNTQKYRVWKEKYVTIGPPLYDVAFTSGGTTVTYPGESDGNYTSRNLYQNQKVVNFGCGPFSARWKEQDDGNQLSITPNLHLFMYAMDLDKDVLKMGTEAVEYHVDCNIRFKDLI